MKDQQLLRQFVEQNSQEAFAALTTRYLNLVYSVCRRELDNAETAEDVTQAVFLILAKKAPALRRNVVLSGWLFQTARFAAKNARIQAQRRAAYEQKAAEAMEQQSEREGAAWVEIEPLLNHSLAALREGERDCILLRFFQGLSFAEVGEVLGLSEEAARKRVTRALEKMRRLFGKQGMIVPSAALAALLSAHAAKAAPAQLTEELTNMLAGHIPGHASLIAQGATQAMNILKWKVAVGAAALLVAGTAAYGIAHRISEAVSVDDPIPLPHSALQAPGTKDAVRNVILRGRVRYEDGKPASGVQVGAQIQNNALLKQSDALRARLGISRSGTVQYPKKEQEESWNNAVSRPDGTFDLPVGADIPYNVMMFDKTGKWVAAAIQGVSGAQNSIVNLPDLVLTKGCLVIGKVTDRFGMSAPFAVVGSYGPDRPETTAASGFAMTDLSGHYRLRVAPGKTRVYLENVSQNQNVELMPGQITTLNFRAQ